MHLKRGGGHIGSSLRIITGLTVNTGTSTITWPRCSTSMGASEHTSTGLCTMNHQSGQQGAGCQRTQNMYSSGAHALPERERNWRSELNAQLGEYTELSIDTESSIHSCPNSNPFESEFWVLLSMLLEYYLGVILRGFSVYFWVFSQGLKITYESIFLSARSIILSRLKKIKKNMEKSKIIFFCLWVWISVGSSHIFLMILKLLIIPCFCRPDRIILSRFKKINKNMENRK